MLSKFSCRWTLAQYQAEKRQEKVWRNKIIITALASAFAPGFLEQHLMKIIFFIQEMLLSLKTSWSAALNPVPDMFLVGWCSRPCFSPKRINLSLEIWISNNLKVHNTYYNNMVCYINNKQSDTDSHQSKVNNQQQQKQKKIWHQVKAGRLTAKSVQSLQSALAEEQRGGEICLLRSWIQTADWSWDLKKIILVLDDFCSACKPPLC